MLIDKILTYDNNSILDMINYAETFDDELRFELYFNIDKLNGKLRNGAIIEVREDLKTRLVEKIKGETKFMLEPTYQKEYNDIIYSINKEINDYSLAYPLIKMINDRITKESLIKFDLFFSDMVTRMSEKGFSLKSRTLVNLTNFITKGHDIYNNLFNKDDLMNTLDVNTISNLNMLINEYIMIGNDSMYFIDNIAKLIYIYYYILDYNDNRLIENRPYHRFQYLLMGLDKVGPNEIEDITRELENIVAKEPAIEEVICELTMNQVRKNELKDVLDALTPSMNLKTEDTQFSISRGDTTIFSKDIGFLISNKINLDNVINELDFMNPDYLIRYIDKENENTEFSFDLTENDLGHINTLKDTELYVVVNKRKTNKFMIKYENELYLLFNIKYSKDNSIYGISIRKLNGNKRKIFKLNKSNKYYYKSFFIK